MAKYCPDNDGPALYPECQECDTKNCEAFFCLIVGSRSFHDYCFLEERMDFLLSNQKKVVIVSGGAKGADSLAEQYAKKRGYKFVLFSADWSKGKRAGYLRNRKMHEYIARQKKRGVVAFWDGKSPGTAQNFELAKEFSNSCKIIYV